MPLHLSSSEPSLYALRCTCSALSRKCSVISDFRSSTTAAGSTGSASFGSSILTVISARLASSARLRFYLMSFCMASSSVDSYTVLVWRASSMNTNTPRGQIAPSADDQLLPVRDWTMNSWVLCTLIENVGYRVQRHHTSRARGRLMVPR